RGFWKDSQIGSRDIAPQALPRKPSPVLRERLHLAQSCILIDRLPPKAMNEVLFVQQREPDWKRLWTLTDKADASPVNLSAQEIDEFVRLYRRVSKDLAIVRTRSNNLQ